MSAHILAGLDRIAALFGARTTTRSMAAEFGPTFATRYPELARYSDLDLIRRDRAELIAEIEAGRAALAHWRELDRLIAEHDLILVTSEWEV